MTKSKNVKQALEQPAKMSPLASKIAEGLENAIEYVEGRSKAGRSTLVSLPDPAPEYDKQAVQQVRKNCGMTQAVFAKLMNVSVKNVEAWESGKKKPGPPARRLMQLVVEPKALEATALLVGYRLVPVKKRGSLSSKAARPAADTKRRAKAAS